MTSALDGLDTRAKAAAIIGEEAMRALESAGFEVFQSPPHGFYLEPRVFCLRCNQEAYYCAVCWTPICTWCNRLPTPHSSEAYSRLRCDECARRETMEHES